MVLNDFMDIIEIYLLAKMIKILETSNILFVYCQHHRIFIE